MAIKTNKYSALTKKANPNGSVKLGNTTYGYKPKRKGKDTSNAKPVDLPEIGTPEGIDTTVGGKKVTTGAMPGMYVDAKGNTIDTTNVSGVATGGLLAGETNEEYNSRLGLGPNDPGYRRSAPGSTPAEDFAFKDVGEEAFYRVSGEVDKTAQMATDLGFESYSALPTNLKDFVDQFIEQQQKSDLAMAEYEKSVADILDERSIEQTRTAGASQAAATEASLLSGREGFVGGTEIGAVKQFKDLIVTEIDSAQKRVDLAKAQRVKALEDLKRAQDRQDFDAAETIKGRIAQAEAAINAETTNMIELEQRGAQIALEEFATLSADQRASYSTFQNLMETGVVMDMPSLLSMSNSLGLPADVVYSAYAGMQAIRDDKSLSVEEKRIGIEQQMNQLRDYQLGLSSATAKKVDDFLKLSQSGNYTAEQLQSFAVAMDIPNDQNPVWMAEQRKLAAEAKIAEAEANGQFISPMERLEYAAASWEYLQATGQAGVYKPTDSKYAVSATADGGIRVGVEAGDRYARGQCGEFVNDVLGIGVGDKLSDKTKFIDRSIGVPQPGMAFVMTANGSAAQYGHIGIVESVNPDGTFNTVESNANGDEKITRETRSITEVLGFIKPNKSEFIGGVEPGVEGTGYTDAQLALMRDLKGEKMSSTVVSELEKAGLTTQDLSLFDPATAPITTEEKDQVYGVLEAIERLKNHEGFNSAVGFSAQELFLPGDIKGEDGFISGTAAADFKAKFDSFRDSLVLPMLDQLKGAMSDNDIKFIRNAATALSLTQSEDAFLEELDNIKETYEKILQDKGVIDSETSTVDLSPDELADKYNPVKNSLTSKYITK